MLNLKPPLGNWLGRGVRLVLGIALVCVTLAYAVDCIASLREGRDARSWIRTEAWVLSTDLACKSRHGGDSCHLAATYRYRFAGEEHRGTRVSVLPEENRSADWHRLWYSQLRNAMEHGTPVSVYVDPQDPDRAALDRDASWLETLFLFGMPTVFLGLGVLLVYGALERNTADPAGARAGAGPGSAAAAPDDPPQRGTARVVWRRDVQVVAQPSRERLTPVAILFWAIAATAGAALMFIALVCSNALPQDNEILFFYIGAIPVIRSHGLFKRHRASPRIGRPILVMDPYPGAIGGELAGYSDLAWPSSKKAEWQATLACLRRTEPTDRGGQGKERIEWQASGAPLAQAVVGTDSSPAAGNGRRLALGERGTRLSVRFAVPAGLPASGQAARVRYLWRLTLKVGRNWPAIERRFEIEMQPGTQRSEGLGQVPVTNGAE